MDSAAHLLVCIAVICILSYQVLAELAELGFVSVLVYVPSQMDWFVALSGDIFNDCNHLLHLIHGAHFLVFWAMLAFLGLILVLTGSSIIWIGRWTRFEKAAQGEPDIAQVFLSFT